MRSSGNGYFTLSQLFLFVKLHWINLFFLIYEAKLFFNKMFVSIWHSNKTLKNIIEESLSKRGDAVEVNFSLQKKYTNLFTSLT